MLDGLTADARGGFAVAAILSGFRKRRFHSEVGQRMSSVCDVCAKKPIFGKRLSHSHRRTNRRWNPNVQKVRAVVNGAPKRLNVCTACLKAGKIQKP